MTQHISFDLETLGLAHDALILSIGAVKFNPFTGTIGVPDSEAGVSTFYRVIDLSGPGGVIDASTVGWWMQQSDTARNAIFGKDVERVPLPQALAEFSEWIGFTDELEDGEYPDVVLWARGNKDGQWLESAYKGIGFKAPFKYWQVQDQRTLTATFPELAPRQAKEDVAHNALDDAMFQAVQICKIYLNLIGAGLVELPADEPVVAAAPNVIDVPLVNEEDEALRQKVLRWADERKINSVGYARERYIADVVSDKVDVLEINEAFSGWTGTEKVSDFLDKNLASPE